MLKIKKDNAEMIVTSGAYENLYKDMGYEIVSDNTVKKAADVKPAAPTSPIKDEVKEQKPEIKKDSKGNK